MNLTMEAGIPALTVFVQGVLSFFSPCVLPLVPLYVSYLSGGARVVEEDGTIHYPRGKVMVNTVFFVVGISFAFFLLGFGFTALGRFFSGNRLWFARICGILMILFGLYQLGLFGRKGALERERRLPLHLERFSMNPLVALALGFGFSFAWTPCVGPALAGVLLMASSASSASGGFLLVGVYTLGFILPFLAVGLFTGKILELFAGKRNMVRYTVKIGGCLLILMGIMTLTGFMNGISAYLSRFTPGGGMTPESGSPVAAQETAGEEAPGAEETGGGENGPEAGAPEGDDVSAPETEAPADEDVSLSEEEDGGTERIQAPDFTLTDQYGESHTFSEYRGKTVFLNFWATWCPPCQGEMPDIQALYERYGENQEDLIVLGVANPRTETNPRNQDVSVEEVTAFLEEKGYTFPVVMDTTGELFSWYGIQALPTTFMIDRDGNIFGYVPGALTADFMESIVQQTMEGVREDGNGSREED